MYYNFRFPGFEFPFDNSAITTTTTPIAGGTGTLGDPYQVATPAHLMR